MYGKFKELKIKYEYKPRVDNLIFRLHYRYTVTLYLVGAIVSTLYDQVGEKIICMLDTGRDDLKSAVNSYCYITGTYTVDKYHYSGADLEVPHPGVGPHRDDDIITYHTYYQWVPFVLVAQGALFYLPHYIWKGIEKGVFKVILQKLTLVDYLSGNLGNYNSRFQQFELLSLFIRDNFKKHQLWAYKFIFCELLNVLVTLFTIFFTNFFLGGEFFTYGLKVFSISAMDPENRTDPMAQVFPQMGKCLFKMYGPSGTVEKRDVMCLLPTNVANEKIYIALWVWLIILMTLGTIWIVIRIISMIKFIREPLFKFRVVTLPRLNKKSSELCEALATSGDVKGILNYYKTFSDYVLLSQLGDNMENTLFSEFMHYFSKFIIGDGIYNSSSLNDSGVSETDSIAKEPVATPEKERLVEGGRYPTYPTLQQETTFDTYA